MVNYAKETRNVIDHAENRKLLGALRARVGDDGSHFPKFEAIVQEFLGL
jgi:hypothetical protein